MVCNVTHSGFSYGKYASNRGTSMKFAANTLHAIPMRFLAGYIRTGWLPSNSC